MDSPLVTLFTCFAGFIVIIIIRVSMCLPQYARRVTLKTASAWIIFGSGGHTGEMIRLLKNTNTKRFTSVHYVIAKSDSTSRRRIESAELALTELAQWHKVYRSREVKQSWLSTVFTTVYALFEAFLTVLRHRPTLIICNGPGVIGTCVPLVLVAFSFHLMGIYRPVIIFVESFCRVESLSLTGRLLYLIADRFIVQWPLLAEKYSRAEYLGKIC